MEMMRKRVLRIPGSEMMTIGQWRVGTTMKKKTTMMTMILEAEYLAKMHCKKAGAFAGEFLNNPL